MNMTGIAIRHPPSFCSAQLFRFGVPIWRPRRSLMRTVRDAFALPGSGMVQAGVLCALCLGAPDQILHGSRIDANSVTPRAELPAGRPGQRRQKEVKQFASSVEIALKQPVYST